MNAVPELRSGTLIAQRIFDVAFAIDLPAVEQLWAARSGPSSRRGRLSNTQPKAVAFDVPPVVLDLEPLQLSLAGEMFSLAVQARFYDFGVLSLALQLPVSHCSWTRYRQLLEALDQAVGPRAQSTAWPELLDKLRVLTGSAYQRPTTRYVQEDYLCAVVHEFAAPLRAEELLERVDLAALLAGETRPLSPGAQRDLLSRRFSYYEDDLVVLSWERAFIYDPRGDSDVADVLEIANAQLLEMRYYDELLDEELPRMYDLVEATQRSVWPVAPARYARLARKLYALVAEVTELKEKVDNALQVTEDVYLARVYSAALDQFRVPSVSQAVDRKLAIIRDTYIALYDEASSRRAELLEVSIVLLIVMELALALLRH